MKRLVLLAAVVLSGCAVTADDLGQPGFSMTETMDGRTLVVEFENAAYIDASPAILDDGTVIEPFPAFYDGVTVRLSDQSEMSEQDGPQARAMAAAFCGRAGLVSGNPEGWFLPTRTGWFFGRCQMSDVDG